MAKEWKPDAPNAKQAFNGKDEPEKTQPVSKSEQERLEAMRETPEIAQALTPPGISQVQANDNQREEREKRIAYIKDRLEANRNRGRDEFRNNSR